MYLKYKSINKINNMKQTICIQTIPLRVLEPTGPVDSES